MVNSVGNPPAHLRLLSLLVGGYVAVVAATIAAMGVLSVVAPDMATTRAWVHVAIVAVFAVVMPLRLRQLKRGSARARQILAIVAGVLLIANIDEANIDGLFPGWMRIEMVLIAALMAAIVVATLRLRLRP